MSALSVRIACSVLSFRSDICVNAYRYEEIRAYWDTHQVGSAAVNHVQIGSGEGARWNQ